MKWLVSVCFFFLQFCQCHMLKITQTDRNVSLCTNQNKTLWMSTEYSVSHKFSLFQQSNTIFSLRQFWSCCCQTNILYQFPFFSTCFFSSRQFHTIIGVFFCLSKLICQPCLSIPYMIIVCKPWTLKISFLFINVATHKHHQYSYISPCNHTQTLIETWENEEIWALIFGQLVVHQSDRSI